MSTDQKCTPIKAATGEGQIWGLSLGKAELEAGNAFGTLVVNSTLYVRTTAAVNEQRLCLKATCGDLK